MALSVAVITSLCVAAPRIDIQTAFSRNVASPLVAVRKDVTLREFLTFLSAERHLAIWLDRRIDPGQRIDISLNAPDVESAMRELTGPLGADVRIVGDTLLIGPGESVSNLRTRVALAEQKYREQIQKLRPPPTEVLQRRTVNWADVTSPRDLVGNLAGRAQVSVENLGELPHDLWIAGTFGHVNFVEALVLIGDQFGLDVVWDSPSQARFVPAVPRPVITRDYPVPGAVRDDLPARLKAAGLSPDVWQENRVTLTGRVEEHERLQSLLRRPVPAGRPGSGMKGTGAKPEPTFTLQMKDAPLSGLLESLAAQGKIMTYDAEELKRSGIDLNQRISLQLSDATLSELLSAACGPAGLSFEMEENRIRLFPAQPAGGAGDGQKPDGARRGFR